MNNISPYMHPATLVSYDKEMRTAKVTIKGLTDGVDEGITAMLAYPIGDDDLDTERELIAGADVWVFFEQGDTTMPVIAFYRRHGQGRAAIDVRRIRQENIELLARARVTITAKDLVFIQASSITIEGSVLIKGNITHDGNQTVSGNITASGDVKAAGKSLKNHVHGGVKSGGGTTGQPQ